MIMKIILSNFGAIIGKVQKRLYLCITNQKNKKDDIQNQRGV